MATSIKGSAPSSQKSSKGSSKKGSKGSSKKSSKGSSKKSSKGSSKKSSRGESPEASKKGSPKGSNKDSKGSSKGRKKDSKGSSKGSKKGSKGSSKGSKKDSKGSSKGSKKGSKGSSKGSKKNVPKHEPLYTLTDEVFQDKRGRTIIVLKRRTPLPPFRAKFNVLHLKNITVNQVDFFTVSRLIDEEETTDTSHSSTTTTTTTTTTQSGTATKSKSGTSGQEGPVDPEKLREALEELQSPKSNKKSKEKKKEKKEKKSKQKKEKKKKKKKKKEGKVKKDGKRVKIGDKTIYETESVTWNVASDITFKKGISVLFTSYPEDLLSNLLLSRLQVRFERWKGIGEGELVGVASLGLNEYLQRAIHDAVHNGAQCIDTHVEEEMEIRDILKSENNEIGVAQVIIHFYCYGEKITSNELITDKGLYNTIIGTRSLLSEDEYAIESFRQMETGPREEWAPFFQDLGKRDLSVYTRAMKRLGEYKKLDIDEEENENLEEPVESTAIIEEIGTEFNPDNVEETVRTEPEE